jgi:hypothetical protein
MRGANRARITGAGAATATIIGGLAGDVLFVGLLPEVV